MLVFGKYSKPVKKNISVHKDAAANLALQKLRSYLNAAEPEMVYFLVNTWNAQGRAITYKEIREALLKGDIDQEYIEQWQEDYSKFVKEHLEPAWNDAMEAATAEMAKKYPDWNFDPYADGVRKWTQNRAAEFVTNSSYTQIEGLRAVIRKATVLEDMNVDQLSRAIRPMVGLTHQQSIANLNYYNKLLENGISEKKAMDLSIRYSARQHRYRAYNIARTELAFAYNQGSYQGIKQAQAAGYMGEVKKVWCTADDERTCEICGSLEGKEIAMDDEFGFKTKLSVVHTPTIKMVPPAHPSCRCTTLYIETEAPQWVKDGQNPNQLPDAAGEMDDEPFASIPEDYELPSGLKYTGSSSGEGTGKNYTYIDEDGNEYIFKPGINEDGSNAVFRVYVQEAGYKVQHIIDPDTAVPVRRFENFTEFSIEYFGAMQKKIQGTIASSYLDDLYHDIDIPAQVKSQLMREHVTDWLMANFDAHGNQFMFNKAGTLVGLNKDQAFRYLTDSGAKKMSYSFHPNKAYGEKEPIYNPLYRLFASGDIDLDPNDVLPYIKRVEAISNKEYREIFRKYAESLNGPGKAAEALLDDILDRKINLRETYREFFEELLEERSSGIKAVFKFADEGAVAAKQALASQTMTKEAALKMTSAELKKIAKDKGIPSAINMTKEQLATCLSDPTQIPAMNAQVNEKLRAQSARRRAAQAGQVDITPTQGKYTVTNGVYRANEVFDDFSAIPNDRKLGISVASDSSFVEGQRLTARKVRLNGEEYYEVSGKLTETKTDEIENMMQFNNHGDIVFGKGPLTDGIAALDDMDWITSGGGIKLTQSGATIELITDKGRRALMGEFRVRIKTTGDPLLDASRMKNVLQTSEFKFVLDAPTAADEDIYKKARLLFQKNPDAAVAFSKVKEKGDFIDTFLQVNNIDPDEIKNFVKEEVYPGYYTYVNKGVHKAYQKEGLEYVWSGVSDKESVVAMVKSGGMASSMSRIKTGFAGNGASVSSDIGTGGADNVFTRIATKGAKSDYTNYNFSFASGNYQIVIKPEVMDRTDWYAYEFDNYGRTTGDEMKQRLSSMDFVKSQNTDYRNGNEVMFRHGIDLKDWACIDCASQTDKDRLLDALRAEGITQINGVNIENFVRINQYVGTPLK